MKFSPGTYIAIAFGMFIVFILTLVVKTYQFKVDLVSEDYYGQELKYQEKIDRMNHTKADSQWVEVHQYDEFLELDFYPDKEKVTGKVEFYRPSDATKDIMISVSTTKEGKQQVSKNLFVTGLYKMKVDWQVEGVDYYTEQDIYIQ